MRMKAVDGTNKLRALHHTTREAYALASSGISPETPLRNANYGRPSKSLRRAYERKSSIPIIGCMENVKLVRRRQIWHFIKSLSSGPTGHLTSISSRRRICSLKIHFGQTNGGLYKIKVTQINIFTENPELNLGI